MRTGERIEALKLYGFKDGEKLTEDEREDIIDYTLRFEECQWSREHLEAEDDAGLIHCAYWVMAEYASGQV